MQQSIVHYYYCPIVSNSLTIALLVSDFNWRLKSTQQKFPHWEEQQNETIKMKSLQSLQVYTVLFVFASIVISTDGRVAFEKLTDFDFSGQTYYSVKNLSLYECQGWCREEQDCQAAAFSFVVNPLTPAQETLCQLQNDSSAHNPSATPQRSASMYYMVKLQVSLPGSPFLINLA